MTIQSNLIKYQKNLSKIQFKSCQYRVTDAWSHQDPVNSPRSWFHRQRTRSRVREEGKLEMWLIDISATCCHSTMPPVVRLCSGSTCELAET